MSETRSVERWCSIDPKQHAARYVREVVAERLYRENMAAFRVRWFMGASTRLESVRASFDWEGDTDDDR